MRVLGRLVRRLSASLLGRRNDQRWREEVVGHLTADRRVRSRRSGTGRGSSAGSDQVGVGDALTKAYRDQERIRWLENVVRNVHYDVRHLVRAPLFTICAVITLSLTMVATIATLRLLDVVVLRKQAIPEPERLVQITGGTRSRPSGAGLSLPAFQRVAQARQSLSAIIGWTQAATFTVEANGAASRATVVGVTGKFFGELGAHSVLGRLLLPTDEDIATARGQDVAVVSYPFWQRQLNASTHTIGRHITVEGQVLVVVGVAPKGFTGVGRVVEPDIAVP